MDIPVHHGHRQQEKSFDAMDRMGSAPTGLKAHDDHKQMLHEPEFLPTEPAHEEAAKHMDLKPY